MNRLRSKKAFSKCFEGDLKLVFVFIMKTFFSMQGVSAQDSSALLPICKVCFDAYLKSIVLSFAISF